MNNTSAYDVIVIGAGPAGAEAAMASGRAAANTLCLSINLDTVGFHPATPLLVEDKDDIRAGMLKELAALGAALPRLLDLEAVKAPDGAGKGREGRIVIDRRNLGLAYKEALESAANVRLRQALAVSIEAAPLPQREGKPETAGWRLTTNLGEVFEAATVVIAAGTFLNGMVTDGGVVTPGGRLGEIPARALAESLAERGFRLTQIYSETPPRIDAGSVEAKAGPTNRRDLTKTLAAGNDLIADGEQLNEMMVNSFWPRGSRTAQLKALRKRENELEQAWMTRASWTLTHLALEAAQVDHALESPENPGIFFAGRASGTCNFVEAAMTGLVAGVGAAARATGRPLPNLICNTNYVDLICTAVAEQESRPVTIRITGPGC